MYGIFGQRVGAPAMSNLATNLDQEPQSQEGEETGDETGGMDNETGGMGDETWNGHEDGYFDDQHAWGQYGGEEGGPGYGGGYGGDMHPNNYYAPPHMYY
jgi:hypothetical protein